ncbi:MAG: 16S rRNA (cytosine(1402)-N(4))-methyltransferase [Candidatus Marinimicrobia bacterium]|nr:16S rRNA (cytosine(1402)-N(4))-methyltransferase [Candidatus Neomarinimicrobiota bacterium]|tara:strand:+ start:2030 stop:2923 length:894 start_codon:yes stop_codon:yes gene_type:complete
MAIPSGEGTKIHVPVMPQEVLKLLNIVEDGIYVDGTIGIGGHAGLILSHLSPKGHLVGIDRDEEALEICKNSLNISQSRLSIFNDSYHNLNSILDSLEINKVNGILLDLGMSSLQLDSKKRGFSYKRESKLDMRFDQSQKKSAYDILNKLPEKDIANIIFNNSQERYSRRIAKKIFEMRPISMVSDLVEGIRLTTPPSKRNKTIARVFQAIRIAVNDELNKLELFLDNFSNRLTIGGKIVIISFHSLEDRIVKHSFRELKKKNVIRIITKKPVYPSDEEILSNKKSSSAKLRSAEKI